MLKLFSRAYRAGIPAGQLVVTLTVNKMSLALRVEGAQRPEFNAKCQGVTSALQGITLQLKMHKISALF